jgi:hypothetical protein
MGISVLFLMISFEGFGLFSFSTTKEEDIRIEAATIGMNAGNPSSATISSVSTFFGITNDHSTFFALLSFAMTIIAWMRFISLDNMFLCFFYSVIFSFISTKAMIHWSFPYHKLISHSVYHHHLTHPNMINTIYYYPFFFLFILKLLNTFISLWNPKNSFHNITFSTVFPLLYLITLLWPFANLLICCLLYESVDINEELQEDHQHAETLINKNTIYQGIILSTLIGNINLTLSFRLKEILNYMMNRNETISSTQLLIPLTFLFPLKRLITGNRASTPSSSSSSSFEDDDDGDSSSSRDRKGYSLVLMNCFVTIMWGCIVIFFQITNLDYDLFFPLICLIILVYNHVIDTFKIPFFGWMFRLFSSSSTSGSSSKHKPLHVWMIFAVSFWFLSAFYHLFIMDFFLNVDDHSGIPDYFKHLSYLTNVKPYSYFNFDSNVSLWSCESTWTPWLNILYLLITFPSIYYSILNRSHTRVVMDQSHHNRSAGGGGGRIGNGRGGVSDDTLFLIALLCMIPIIGANVDCIRYLGIIGLCSGIYYSNYMFKQQKQSNEYI